MRVKRAKVILSLPRCATHFFWARHIASGCYQMSFDADILPALMVLSRKFKGAVPGFFPAPGNPYYNFQFNSLADAPAPLTLEQWLDRLSVKYGAAPGFELFQAMLDRQANGDKVLLVANRFVYTCSYDFLIPGVAWTLQDAFESLRLFRQWAERSSWEFQWMFMVREAKPWVGSLRRLYGQPHFADLRIREFPEVVETVRAMGVEVYSVEAAIQEIKAGRLEFCDSLAPLEPLGPIPSGLATLGFQPGKSRQPGDWRLYLQRTWEYLREGDDFRRLSLARSLGPFVRLLGLWPGLKARHARDMQGVILNNARIAEPGQEFA